MSQHQEGPTLQELRAREVALLERQRAEYSKMAAKVSRLNMSAEEVANVQRRLRQVEEALAAKRDEVPDWKHRSTSKVWRRQTLREAFYADLGTATNEAPVETLAGELILSKYSVTATLGRNKADDNVITATRTKQSPPPPSTRPSPAESAHDILRRYSAKRVARADDDQPKTKPRWTPPVFAVDRRTDPTKTQEEEEEETRS